MPMEEVCRSWADYLKDYEAAKRSVPPSFQGSIIPKRITAGIVLQRQHQYNPILHLYRTKELENEAVQREKAEECRHLARGRKFQGREKHDDILVHTSSPTQATGEKQPQRRFRRQASTSIPQLLAQDPRRDAFRCNRSRSQLPAPREFNIVSNAYLKDHEARIRKDRQVEHERAQAKLSSRKHDPVLGCYVDCNPDAEVQSSRETLSLIAKTNREAERRNGKSSSGLYNLITHETYDATQLRSLDEMESKRLAKYSMRHTLDAKSRERDSHNVQAVYTHFSKTMSPLRFASGTGGYDILTNAPRPVRHIPFSALVRNDRSSVKNVIVDQNC